MKRIINNKYALIGITLIVGALVGWLIKPSDETISESHDHAIESSDHQEFTCSMHPQIRQNEPGDCPICGMELIPVSSEADHAIDPMAVNMSATAMQLANISTAIVGQMDPVKSVNLNGKVQEDERRIFTQPAHVGGRVERLAVNFTGEFVRKGQPLAYLYSPELVTAQEELFIAYKIRESQPRLYQAAREKLKNWKLTDSQIDRIIESGKVRDEFPVLADVSGYVTSKMVKLGDYVQRGAPIYQIADLSQVWVQFDVYESDLSWVNEGNEVQFTVRSLPGQVFNQEISYIDPVIDPQTRVAKARVEMANPDNLLKPEMFASGVVQTNLKNRKDALVVPKSAVMWTGERSVVYVKTSSEKGVNFMMREVTIGPALGESYVVEEGLETGEEIAVSGTFSIDAAAQLAGKPSMMNREGPAGQPMPGHDHGNMNTMPSAEHPIQNSEVTVGTEAASALKPVLDEYLKLKNALVSGGLMNARENAETLNASIDQVDMSLFQDEAHMLWMNYSQSLKEAVKALAGAEDLEEARDHFIRVSNQMIELVSAFEINEKALYVQRCPMADQNNGANWLSREEEIRNPYFGEAMLTCGEVIEVLKVQ